MVEVREVTTPALRRAFLNFPLKLYRGNDCFVPPLYGDEKKLFRKDYHYYEHAEAVYFIALRGKKVVGRISGIIQRAANERWHQKRVRFTRFDCIDDKEVAAALFGKVEAWAREKGMEEAVGPLGFSDLEREGLLIEGFDELSTFEEQYNYPYYQALIEGLGYEKEVDWVEHKLYAPAQPDERIREVREKMMQAAVLAAKTVNYTSLGTIEFLLDKQNNFYFMEMNTRLQVEHPVTEYVTGIDIVKWQIRIAAGIEFLYKQEDIRFRGCAIECRINAEDVRNNFRPCCGQIKFMHIPGGPWVRFDTAIYQDYMIPPYYDSMIGKLIVYARERTEAIRKMKAALCELVIDGVHTNAELSADILAQPEFKDGSYCTNFLEKFLKNYK